MFLKNYFGREETKSVTKELVGSILEEEITEIDWIYVKFLDTFFENFFIF